VTGKLERTLIGHGGDVNDLAISPTNPQILASASEDHTVRLWSLQPAHKRQPCAVIYAGDGHRDTILTIAFHANGRYLLSGGQDHVVNLWTVPELPEAHTGGNKPTKIHYPHFSTSELHSNIVDCVAFHGDLILSKALHEHCIVLWAITGFSSASKPPPQSAAPTAHDNQLNTRSAFSAPDLTTKSSTQYIRILEFAIPGCGQFYMRFSLYSPLPSFDTLTHPILAITNSSSKTFFWDLTRLEAYFDYIAFITNPVLPPFSTPYPGHPPPSESNLKRPYWLVPIRSKKENSKEKDVFDRLREPSSSAATAYSDQTTDTMASTSLAEIAASREHWDKKYGMGGEGRVEAHRVENASRKAFTGRQVGWSRGGEWCVVVGSENVVALFQRWGGRERKGRGGGGEGLLPVPGSGCT